ncbi:MAG: ribonuclease III [Vallitaleaceae bacterium]|jgi:ribonuclease-3 family protein|nr:ribonuclease III [Vallitaleaceae bacterium]
MEHMLYEHMHQSFDELFEVSGNNPTSYSPLVLAYIGDGIYELMIRTYIVKLGNAPVNAMHKKAKSFVNAGAQKELFYKIEPVLTEEEMNIFKRGRNAKSNTKAKNASMSDYKTATGLEALFGYLYLQKDIDRIMTLIAKGVIGDE